MKTYISAFALTMAISSTAAAQNIERTFDSSRNIAIEDFTGVVDLTVGGDTVTLTLTEGAKPYPVEIFEKDGVVFISGHERPRNYQWRKDYGRRSWKDEDAFQKYLGDYPVLKITAPAGSNLEIDSAIIMATAGDMNGDLSIEHGYVEAVIGDVKNADIGIGSAGGIVLGDVNADLNVAIGGSGDFSAASARTATLIIGGSGDIDLGKVSGEAKLVIGGSGDIEVNDIAGSLSVNIGGSGDVRLGDIAASAALSVSGSGDIEVDSVNGETNASISGSGDIYIASGRAENLRVSISGSGDFTFGGVSTNLNASLSGSGSVTVAENEGSLHTSGRGDFRVGGVRIDED